MTLRAPNGRSSGKAKGSEEPALAAAATGDGVDVDDVVDVEDVVDVVTRGATCAAESIPSRLMRQ